MKRTDHRENEISEFIGATKEGFRSLQKQIEEGFRGVHERQDVANGKLSKHETQIDDLNVWRGNLMGKIAVILGILSVAVTVILKLWKK